jgi:hypothetical protein
MYHLNQPETRILIDLELDAYAKQVEREMQAYRPAFTKPVFESRMQQVIDQLRRQHPGAADTAIQHMAYKIVGAS